MSYTKNYLELEMQSYYNVYDKTPKRVTLEYLLHLSDKYLTKDDKKSLPCFQPHGVGVGRELRYLYSHTGLVQLDFDLKLNERLSDPLERSKLIDALIDSGNVVCAQTSAGGSGVWALLAVEDITKENHSELADEVDELIGKLYGYYIDVPVARNLASLRFLSPAKDLKINEYTTPVKL